MYTLMILTVLHFTNISVMIITKSFVNSKSNILHFCKFFQIKTTKLLLEVFAYGRKQAKDCIKP